MRRRSLWPVRNVSRPSPSGGRERRRPRTEAHPPARTNGRTGRHWPCLTTHRPLLCKLHPRLDCFACAREAPSELYRRYPPAPSPGGLMLQLPGLTVPQDTLSHSGATVRPNRPSAWLQLAELPPLPSSSDEPLRTSTFAPSRCRCARARQRLSRSCERRARTSLCLRYLRDRLRLRGQSASGFSGELFPDAAGLLSPRVHSWCPPSFLSRPIARRARLLSVRGSISCCSRRTGAPHCCSCPSKNKHETLYLPPEMRGQCASALNGRPAYAPSFVCILGNRWIELVVVGWVCVSSRRMRSWWRLG